MADKPNILVIGATGFIGAHVVRTLRRRGYPVRAMRRGSSETWHLEGVDLEWVVGDLDQAHTLSEAVEGCAAVIHAGAYYPRGGLAVDAARRRAVGQLRRLCEVCLRARVARLVFVSSPVTLGLGEDPQAVLDETDLYVPGSIDNAYFEAKWSMEAELYRYIRRGLPAVITVPTAVFGPGDLKATMGEFLLRLARGKLPAVIGECVNVVDVRDVADAIVSALERGRPGRRYILGGVNTTVDELAEQVAEIVGIDGPRYHLPSRPVQKVARVLEKVGRTTGIDLPAMLVGVDLIAHARHVSSERARAELDAGARPVEETLADAISWFEAHDYLSAHGTRR